MTIDPVDVLGGHLYQAQLVEIELARIYRKQVPPRTYSRWCQTLGFPAKEPYYTAEQALALLTLGWAHQERKKKQLPLHYHVKLTYRTIKPFIPNFIQWRKANYSNGWAQAQAS